MQRTVFRRQDLTENKHLRVATSVIGNSFKKFIVIHTAIFWISLQNLETLRIMFMSLCHVSLIGKAPVLKTGVAIKSIMRSSRMRGAYRFNIESKP